MRATAPGRQLGAPGEPAPAGRQNGRALRTGAGLAARLARALLGLALAGAVFAGVGLAVLSWRLAQGPVDVGWAARWIEAAADSPNNPTRLHVGAASVEWGAFGGGADRSLELHLRDVQVTRSGRPVAEAVAADVAVAPAALLWGEVEPREVQVNGLRLRLARAANGSIALAGSEPASRQEASPPPSVAEALAALTRPPGAGPSQAAPGLQRLRQLRTVQLRDAALSVEDQALGATLDVSDVFLNLRRDAKGGLAGSGTAALAVGAARSELTLRAEAAENDARITASLSPVSLQALLAALPTLHPAASIDAPAELSAVAVLFPDLSPRSVSVHAAAGNGRVRLPAQEVAFASMVLDATGEWDAAAPGGAPAWGPPNRVTLPRAEAVVASPAGGRSTTLRATGQATWQADKLHADVAMRFDQVAFADLPKLWPAAWGGHTRQWLTENITAGTARNGQLRLGLDGAKNLSSLVVAAAGGSLQGNDLTIHWLRPVPPIEHGEAVLTVEGPDSIAVAVLSGRQGAGRLSNGTVRITGLTKRDQQLSIGTDVAVPVPDLLTLLRHPRLHLLDQHPLPVRDPGGEMNGRLSVGLPLVHDLTFSAVTIHAQGRLSRLRLGGVVAGRDLDQGELDIDVTADALRASGRAAIATIPAALTLDMDFRAGPPSQVQQRATASGVATARQLTAAGLDAGGLLGAGSGAFDVAYEARRDGGGEVRAEGDLRGMAMAFAGWAKPPGAPASASARLVLQHDRLAGISELEAQGPGLLVHGRAETTNGRPSRLLLNPIRLGATRAHGDVRFPARHGEPIRATLSGTVLDLSNELDRKPSPNRSVERDFTADGSPWVADVAFDKLLLTDDGSSLQAVSAHAEYDGRRLRVLQAQSGGPEQVQASIQPHSGGRHVSVRAADAGTLLRAAGTGPVLAGGQLAVDGDFDDSRSVPVLTGVVNLRQFHVLHAPAVGKVLQALTVYGIGDAMSGPGLLFTRLLAPFRWDGSVLELRDSQAFSLSLGVTARGRADVARRTLDLQGTVVPAYALNSALGRIPLVGRLFSAERGGGLFAVNVSVRGPFDDPAVSVNPLSALTPGFLRRLFRLFG